MANLSTKQWQAFSEELASVVDQVGGSVVTIQTGHRHAASGVLWDNSSVVSVSHAVQREDEVAVTLAPGKTVRATVVGRDHSTDLAVLKLAEPADLQPAQFGGDSGLKVGDYVLALARTRRGNPVASSGVISGLMGPWRTWRGGNLDQFIRPDLNLYSGFSGGPLVNARAQVIGINSSALRRGVGITIPQTTMVRVVKELLEKGHIARPYLGIAMQPVPIPESLRKKENLENASGLLVMHVQTGGPGESAGLLLGDLVLEIAGKPVADTDDVQQHLGTARIGDKVNLTLIRGGVLKTIAVELAERPSSRE